MPALNLSTHGARNLKGPHLQHPILSDHSDGHGVESGPEADTQDLDEWNSGSMFAGRKASSPEGG